MADFSIEEQNAGLSPAQIRKMRWPAIEAAAGAPDLSGAVRQVLITLVCMMNSESGECFPSELGIAKFLDMHIVTVKKAKSELRQKGYITWTNPGGPRHKCQYLLNWRKLLGMQTEARRRSKDAVDARRAERSVNSSRAATKNGSQMATKDECSKVAGSRFNGSQKSADGSQTATAKVAATLPEQLLEQPLVRTAYPEHDASASGWAEECSRAFARPIAAKHAAPEHLNGPANASSSVIKVSPENLPVQPLIFYPALREAFGDDPALLTAIGSMGHELQSKAAKRLAMKGREEALALILLPRGESAA